MKLEHIFLPLKFKNIKQNQKILAILYQEFAKLERFAGEENVVREEQIRKKQQELDKEKRRLEDLKTELKIKEFDYKAAGILVNIVVSMITALIIVFLLSK